MKNKNVLVLEFLDENKLSYFFQMVEIMKPFYLGMKDFKLFYDASSWDDTRKNNVVKVVSLFDVKSEFIMTDI